MKKYFFLFIAAAAAVLTLASCEVEPVETVDGDDLTTVYIHAGTSKTTLDGKYVNWEASDAIKVCYAGGWNHMYQFTIDGTPSGGEATFKGEIDVEAEKAVNPDFYVEALLYPYQGDNYNQVYASSGTLKGVTLPANQAFVDGSFASGVNVAVAPHSTDDFTFYSIGSIIAVPVTGDATIAKAVLKGNNGETLAGKYDVSIDDRSLSNVTSGSSEITLTATTPVSVSGGKTFVFVLAPTAFTSGFSIAFYDNDGKTFKKTYTASVETHTGKKATLNPVTVNAADFAEPVNLAKNWNVMAFVPKANSVAGVADLNSANDMVGDVYLAASKCDGSDTNWPKNTVGAQKYVVQYNRYGGQILFFDLDDVEISGMPGCYALINLQDRNNAPGSTWGQISNNNSYYNSVDDVIVFDFVREGSHAYGYMLYMDKDMSAYDLTGDYTVTQITPTTSAASVNPAANMVGAIYDASTKCDGSDSNWPENTKGNQQYVVQYNWYSGQILFFDLSSVPVPDKPGCYYLTNFQDRNIVGTVTNNNSYYDTSDGSVVFDFVRESTNTYGYKLTR